MPEDPTEPTNQIILYEFYWRSPTDNPIVSIKAPITHLRHTLYVRNEQAPTKETYDWKKLIENEDWSETYEIKVILPGTLYKISDPINVYIGIFIDSGR